MARNKDITKKDEKTLQGEIAEKRGELQQFRFGVTGGKVKDVKRARNIRKGIARIFTELNSRKQ